MCSYDRLTHLLSEHTNVDNVEGCMAKCMSYSSCRYIEYFDSYSFCVIWNSDKNCEDENVPYVTTKVVIYKLTRGNFFFLF